MPHRTEKKGYEERKARLQHMATIRPFYVAEIRAQSTTPQNIPSRAEEARARRWPKGRPEKDAPREEWMEYWQIPGLVRDQIRPRTAGENVRIINAQKKAGRNFAHVRLELFRKLQEGLRAKLNAFEQGASEDTILSGVRKLAQSIVDIYRSNLRSGAGPRRPLKALDPKYAKTKKALYGDKPILERTGQLLNALFVVARKQ